MSQKFNALDHLYAPTAVLDITHLQLIRDILGDKNFDPTKWRDLGSKLQQTDPKLNTIAVKGNHNPSDCLRECLCQWLQSGKASPDTLVNALDSMGLDAAADGIGICKCWCNETPTVRGLAAEKNNKLYMETMIFLWNNHYNLKFNVTVYKK